MATQESIHQGWLYARDGKKFAPMTLIDDVYAMNGQKYKSVVDNKISGVETSFNTALSTVNETLGKHTEAIDALEGIDDEVLEKLTNFGDDGTDALYIVDKSNNVIAYINGLGVHSVDFTLPNENQFSLKDFINNKYASFVTSTNTTLATLTKKLVNFGDDGTGDTLFIVDKSNNVMAYIDETGFHSINVYSANYDMETDLKALYEQLAQEVNDRETAITNVTTGYQTADQGIRSEYNRRLQYFDTSGEESDRLFIVDKNNYVIAYIDAAGVHSLDFFSSSTSLENAYNKLNKEITDRGDAIIELKKYVDTQDSGVTAAYKKAIKDEADARAQADNGLAKSLSDAKQELQGNIDKEIEARQQGDQSNAAAIATNQANISGNASQIANIKKDLENFDLTASDAMYIIDKNTNVLAKFDSVGLTVTNVVLGKVGGRNMQTNGIFYGTSEAKTYNF